MGKRTPATDGWSDRDSALWHTCEIAVDLALGHAPEPRLEIVSVFPSQLAADERYWAAGPYALEDQRARGDGSYRHDSSFFVATGRGGLAATAAVAAFGAGGNARRRRQAQLDAVPRWTWIDGGTLYLSRHGAHMHGAGGVHAWDWPSITAAQMVGPAAVHMFGNSTQGPVSWIVRSDWAELFFLAWAVARHPRHPQLLTGAWLPPGWLARCDEHPYPTRLRTPALQL